MHMMGWDDIQYFLEVVRTGSVTKAAMKLGVNQTTVSRRISALENNLGTHLFERSSKLWSVTAIGERIVETAQRMSEEADTLQRQAMSESQDLSGKLRVTVADVCTQHLLMPVVQLFLQQYPDIDLEIIATRDDLNLAAREADIALRSTDVPPPNLIGHRIGQLGYAIYGSKEMCERVKSGDNIVDIPCITWVGDGHTRPEWIEKNFPSTQRIYRTTELGLMHRMVSMGLGLAQMPCVLCEHDPSLTKINVSYVEPGWGLWVLSHVDLRTTARVRIFRDFLIQELEKIKNKIECNSAYSDSKVGRL